MSAIASRASRLASPLPVADAAVMADAVMGQPDGAAAPLAVASLQESAPSVPTRASVATPAKPADASYEDASVSVSAAATTAAPTPTSRADDVLAATANAVAQPTFIANTANTATVAQLGKPAPTPPSPAPAGNIGGAVLALVMVIGLILALAWLAKRMPGFRGAGGSAALRIVGSLALSPRERLVVVAVGDTQLVLGVGAGGTRTLHTLSEPLPVAAPAAPPAFAQLLAQHFGKKA